jgi:hypothetical protein
MSRPAHPLLSRPHGPLRGAATAEAVVALPFFLLVLVLALQVRRELLAAQTASARARTCAWVYSSTGCREVPPGCRDLVQVRSGDASVDRSLRDGADSALRNGDPSGVVGSIVEALVFPALERAFRRSVDAKVVKIAPSPALVGGEVRAVTAHHRVACNLEPQAPEEVFTDAARALWSDL